MTINAIPDLIDLDQTTLPENYVCPLCQAQSVKDRDSTGWVLCPMLDNQAICLGCCLDHQAVARSVDFDQHPYHSLFDTVMNLSSKSISATRQICLEHQLNIVHGKINRVKHEENKDKYLKLFSEIQTAVDSIK